MVCLNKPTLLTALDIWSKIYLKCAESDGRIDSSEKVLIGMNKVFRTPPRKIEKKFFAFLDHFTHFKKGL